MLFSRYSYRLTDDLIPILDIYLIYILFIHLLFTYVKYNVRYLSNIIVIVCPLPSLQSVFRK